MRVIGGGAKKLIVAFHFHLSKQAGWKCDECRRSGLEKRRGCRHAGHDGEGVRRIVWTHGDHSLTECPKSYISAESMWMLDAYSAWKLTGGRLDRLPARLADAFLALELELRHEVKDVRQ